MSVFVIGSISMDLTVCTKKAPGPGETVSGTSVRKAAGGKGLNQAVAASHMGVPVLMLGAVGKDENGKEILSILEDNNIDTSLIKLSNEPTGAAFITVEESGQNRIVIIGGANKDVVFEDLLPYEKAFSLSDIIVTQCEMREDLLPAIASLSKKYNKRFILNPAPATKIPDEVLKEVYLFTPNEHELSVNVGWEPETIPEYIKASREVLKKGVQNVVVTLGDKGALLVNSEEETLIPAYKTKAIDTVGAGDCFTGTLAAFLSEGKSLSEALTYATAASSISVEREGAVPSLPYREEVEERATNLS